MVQFSSVAAGWRMSDNAPTPELVALLPCPFCGGKAHLERQGHVACMTPRCRGFGAFDNSGTPSEQNGSAVTRWNTRAAPTLPGAGGGDALDARRYRWLRDNDMFDPASQPPELARAFSRYTGSALDAAIDAAMTPQQGG